ncbi:MAG: hypothetical protein NWF06_06345, partial [Candidatus Bathyarchaeota archaeon]|nr:hypothetical protein [Candidatus Bathyarchaeum sp.]
ETMYAFVAGLARKFKDGAELLIKMLSSSAQLPDTLSPENVKTHDSLPLRCANCTTNVLHVLNPLLA